MPDNSRKIDGIDQNVTCAFVDGRLLNPSGIPWINKSKNEALNELLIRSQETENGNADPQWTWPRKIPAKPRMPILQSVRMSEIVDISYDREWNVLQNVCDRLKLAASVLIESKISFDAVIEARPHNVNELSSSCPMSVLVCFNDLCDMIDHLAHNAHLIHTEGAHDIKICYALQFHWIVGNVC